jgi:pSer/pThr/pTyr-binding forkhead associated (FHA) protein
MEQKWIRMAANNHAFSDGAVAASNGNTKGTSPLKGGSGSGGFKMLCQTCRAEIETGEQYCPACGESTSKNNAAIISDVPSVVEMAKWPHLEDEHGHTYPIRPGVNTLGREDTDIVLSDKSVSRRHSVIVFDEAREIFSVEDAGSTNGSRVNGDVLTSHKPRPLQPGDQLSFGNIVVRFATHGYGKGNAYAPQIQSSDDPTIPTTITGDESNAGALGRLELIRGDGPREIYLNKGITTFGRSPDNNVCLSDDRHVSSHHARIDAEGDLFLLIDIGSTNGTYLNGLRLTTNVAVAISDDDEIRVGSALMAFRKTPVNQNNIGGAVEPTLLSIQVSSNE